MPGPLDGYRFVELTGIGPGPFAGMMLADLGGDVLRVDRVGSEAEPGDAPFDVLGRNSRSVAVDLKHPDGRATMLRLVESADGLIEGFRPGVTERLGVGPDDCLARNPRLVYGRMTGFGQSGPYAQMAGHDINYVALSGTLSLLGSRGEPPRPPVNLVGDFGGGGMLLAVGMLAALLEAARSGQGQVVDAAMVDGAALLAAMTYGRIAGGTWGERGTNLIDGGAWFYGTYETADGEYLTFGSLEPQFYSELLRLTGLADDADGRGPVPPRADRSQWPAMRERLAAIVATRSRADWEEALKGTDVCFAPVLRVDEVRTHEHLGPRQTFIEVAGVVQPAPAPRFSRSQPGPVTVAGRGGRDTDAALLSWGFSAPEVEALRASGAVR